MGTIQLTQYPMNGHRIWRPANQTDLFPSFSRQRWMIQVIESSVNLWESRML